MNGEGYELRSLFWEVTKRCNAHCSFCGSSCRAQGEPDELTTEEILAAFRAIAEDTDVSRIMINVTGGEPLLREDLFDVMKVCTGLGFSWGMVSNGMLITDEVIARMRDAGMRTISVSVDGLQQTHERLRGVPGSFSRIMTALRKLREADFLEHIQVTTVVNRQNIGELEQLREVLLPLRLDSWRVAMVDGIGRADGQASLLLGTEEVRAYMDFIREHRNDAALPVQTSCSHFLGYQDDKLGRDVFRCRTGVNVGSILCNGDIFVCPNVPRRKELVQGNVRKDRFMHVWREGFRFFRDPDCRRAMTCRDCPDWSACRGDSMHTWNFDACEPGFCYRRHFPRDCQAAQMKGADAAGLIRDRLGARRAIRVRYEGGSERTLIFTPGAVRDLAAMFHWGAGHPLSLSEQMACLIGRELADATLVEFVSPVFLEMRSTEAAAFSERSWKSAQEELRAVNRAYLTPECSGLRLFEEPCSLVGFVHSHPGRLPLAPSEPDVALHEHLAEEGVGWSVIVNPQTKRLAAFHGAGMTVASALLATDPESDFNVMEK